MGNKLKDEDLKLNIIVNGNDAMKELGDLEKSTRQLTERNKELRTEKEKLIRAGKEDSDQFRAVTKEITENNKVLNTNKDRMTALRNEIGLAGLTMKQLRAEQLRLKNLTDSSTYGTENWQKYNTQLKAVEAQMAVVRGGAQKMNIASALQNIPGPAAAAVQSISTVGKSLWTLVANPVGATIAAIVGSLMLLYKAFTSTDSGANAMAGTLKAIGNVMDILIDRAMSYYKMLWSLVTFDWEGVKTNAIDAFGGIGKAVKDATTAGWDYAHVMDSIGDREAAAQTRMAKLRAEIELLKNQSKDVNKTTKEKSDLIDQAMNKEIELFGIEKGFMKERTSAETSNLASKINNSKMSMAQKQAQLEQWLATDDKELESMMEKDAAFAEFVNKNEEGFQALQKMKAEEFDKDAEFQTETRRLQRSAASEKKALRDEEASNAIESLDIANNERNAKIIEQYANEKLTEAQFKNEMLIAEQAYLVMKKTLLERYGQSTVDVDNQINQKRIEAQKQLNAEMAKAWEAAEKYHEQIMNRQQDLEDLALDESIKQTLAALDNIDKAKDKEAKILEDRKQNYLDFAQQTGQAFGELMNDQEATMADYLKATLLMALEALHQWMKIEEAKILASGIEKGGILGIGLAVAKIAAIEAVYAGVKGALSKKSSTKGYATGGYANEETYRVAEKGPEFIASNPAVRNPDVRQFLDIFDYYQRTGQISKLNTKMILANLPVQQMYAGGYSRSDTGSSSSSAPFILPGSTSGGMSEATARKLVKGIDQLVALKLSVDVKTVKDKMDLLEKYENGGLK